MCRCVCACLISLLIHLLLLLLLLLCLKKCSSRRYRDCICVATVLFVSLLLPVVCLPSPPTKREERQSTYTHIQKSFLAVLLPNTYHIYIHKYTQKCKTHKIYLLFLLIALAVVVVGCHSTDAINHPINKQIFSVSRSFPYNFPTYFSILLHRGTHTPQHTSPCNHAQPCMYIKNTHIYNSLSSSPSIYKYVSVCVKKREATEQPLPPPPHNIYTQTHNHPLLPLHYYHNGNRIQIAVISSRYSPSISRH